MTVPQLVEYYGYGAQQHRVSTEDGYLLTLHRLLAKNASCAERRSLAHRRSKGRCQPVFLQHGLLGSSSAWVLNTPEKALGYILADLGYDVWMGNARGNSYSIGHKWLDTSSKEYWDFDFDQMAKFDLPAAIKYVLRRSKHGYLKLHYVGHSMGTTMFFALETHHPGFVAFHVRSLSALGPVTFLGHTQALMRFAAPFNRAIDEALRGVMGVYHLNDPNNILTKYMTKACLEFATTETICKNLLFMLIGYDDLDLDMAWFNIILKQLNAGGSVRTVVHFAQMILSGQFRMFDYYGDNPAHYNTLEPPRYALDTFQAPALLSWGANDKLADPKDVARLFKEIHDNTPTEIVLRRVPNDEFNHLDFLWGRDAREVCYQDVIDFIGAH